ncbi:MAG: hypothetical protein K2L19_02340 [Eubacterium sp.]|nr:hypothetical protein [Eubacterium sp.]
MKEFKNEILAKRFDNTRLYILGDALSAIRALLVNDNDISKKSKRLFEELYDSVHDDIGHLKCDEYTDIYIVEEGHNYK